MPAWSVGGVLVRTTSDTNESALFLRAVIFGKFFYLNDDCLVILTISEHNLTLQLHKLLYVTWYDLPRDLDLSKPPNTPRHVNAYFTIVGRRRLPNRHGTRTRLYGDETVSASIGQNNHYGVAVCRGDVAIVIGRDQGQRELFVPFQNVVKLGTKHDRLLAFTLKTTRLIKFDNLDFIVDSDLLFFGHNSIIANVDCCVAPRL